jgi:hypothetical protein
VTSQSSKRIQTAAVRKTQPLYFNARSIRNTRDGIPLRHANWLVANLEDIMSIEAGDVTVSRVFSCAARLRFRAVAFQRSVI